MDFSAIWAAADAAGWQLENYASQAGYLLDAGLLQNAASAGATPECSGGGHGANWSARRKWASCSKVIAFSRHLALDALLPGFAREGSLGRVNKTRAA